MTDVAVGETEAAGGPTCLACGGSNVYPLVDLGLAPTSTGALHAEAKAAREVPRGRLDLAVCRNCGHVFNAAFDPELLDYDEDYDNSLHFSPSFRRYARELAGWLVGDVDLHGAHVVEIGSGQGDFLLELTARAEGTGTGYDPTFQPDEAPEGVRFVADYFRPDQDVEAFDLLVARHVLEHLADPAAMLSSLRAAAPDCSRFYLEVPAAEFNFSPEGMWDCIYPHVSYFSATSFAALLGRSGLEVERLGTGFEGQFLWALARPVQPSLVQPDVAEVQKHLERLSRFVDRWDETVGHWRQHLDGDESRLALWGAGAKGVTFLNAVDPGGDLVVVDINPRKWGRFLPGSGHRVVAPETLMSQEPSTVLITNPVYGSEIAEQLRDMGLEPDIVPV